jgi:aminoglycoside phosphotransferase (APT) family kinase protein
MPVAGQRDPSETRARLSAWLAKQLPGADDVEITDLVVPQASGFSNETFLFTAAWTADGERRRADLVLRSQPEVYSLFPEIDLINQQYRTMKLLGEHTDVPVARMRWAEPGNAVLGQPFFVMDRLVGHVPGDSPPYTAAGWFMDLAPQARRRVHRNAVEAMCRVHRVDWRSVGFDYLAKPHHGRLGAEQRRNYFAAYWAWARAGRDHPVADPAWRWLAERWPDDDEHIELCWGDARPGNQMYDDDGAVVGIFDWEMVSLGNAESDLGWFCFLQRFHTEGIGLPVPEGMLRRDEIISCWEGHVGRRATRVDFYERLAGFHFTLVLMRLHQMKEQLDPEYSQPGFDTTNPVAMLTKDLIGIA